MADLVLDRQALAQRGKRLEYFTLAWNSLEGIVAAVLGDRFELHTFRNPGNWLGSQQP